MVLAPCILAGITVVGGLITAASFTVTYTLLSVIPPLVGFHVGVDAISVLMISSIIITVELI